MNAKRELGDSDSERTVGIKREVKEGDATGRVLISFFLRERLKAKPQQWDFPAYAKLGQKWAKIEAGPSLGQTEICPTEDGRRGSLVTEISPLS